MSAPKKQPGSLKTLWHELAETPLALWFLSLSVLALGAGLILASKVPSPFRWERHEPAELARDLGIALVVAPVVTIIYEIGTRRSAKLTELREYINAAMVSFLTKEIWQEILDQVVKRPVTRRNVDISVKFVQEMQLPDGQKKILPDAMAVLEVEYTYDLHRYVATSENVEVGHALDMHMWDPELGVPRFNRIEVIQDGVKRPLLNERRVNELGLVTFDVRLDAKQSAQIISNRFEKIFIPGMYTLIMPEILTPSLESQNTIHLTIEQLPEDVEARATTWFGPHEFTSVPGKTNEWTYIYPMLPGQGLNIVFTKKAIPPADLQNPGTAGGDMSRPAADVNQSGRQ
jgi:hypothetical protein